ncbi:unnamed protein product, partial [marine sediment metagenome]
RAFIGDMKRATNAAGTAPIIGPRSGIRLSRPAINPKRAAKSTLKTSKTIVHKNNSVKV